MIKKDFYTISQAIWRSGYIPDKNKIRQKAKKEMQHLIASNLIGSFKKIPFFNENKFLIACGFNPSSLNN